MTIDIKDEIKKRLRYEPDTGLLYWTEATNKQFRNKVAGAVNKRGHVHINCKGKQMQAHRIAWLLTYGEWPKNGIEHIDKNPRNNRIANLRDIDKCSIEQNNDKPLSNNKTKLLGVSRFHKKWRAQIQFDGFHKYLGSFDTPEMAHEAYMEAKKKYHYGWLKKEGVE